MSLAALILKNLWSKKARSIGIAFAIGVAVMTVVTLTVVSSGLEASAAAVLTLGKADFTVAQNGVSEILYSNLDQTELPGGAVDARGAQRGGGAARDRAPQRGESPLHRDRDPARPATPVRRHRRRGPVIHGGGDPRDDAGLAGRPGLRAPRRRPLHCQRDLEHRRRDLLDGHLLRRPGGHVPPHGAADLQPGPGFGQPHLRQGGARAPRSPRWRRRSPPNTPR